MIKKKRWINNEGKNWSVALEHDEYEDDLELVVRDAIEAVEETANGYYVNVVTPSNLGNPMII